MTQRSVWRRVRTGRGWQIPFTKVGKSRPGLVSGTAPGTILLARGNKEICNSSSMAFPSREKGPKLLSGSYREILSGEEPPKTGMRPLTQN